MVESNPHGQLETPRHRRPPLERNLDLEGFPPPNSETEKGHGGSQRSDYTIFDGG